jgi:hypothetical protein
MRGGDVLGILAGDDGSPVDTIRWADSAPDSVHELKVSLAKAETVNIVLEFRSVGEGTGEIWTDTVTTRPRRSTAITFSALPKSPRRR